MPTIAEQWIEEGREEGRKGLLDGIEGGLECKFGKDGLMLLPEIRTIHNFEVLTAIIRKLWTADNPDELRAIYRDA